MGIMHVGGKSASNVPWSRSTSWSLLPALLLSLLSAALVFAQGAGETPSIVLSPSIAVSPGWDVPLGTTIVFDASTSDHSVPEELVDEVRFIWDLGDGTVRVGERVTHRYATPGTFRIVLTMEVFEQSSIFHRSTETAEVTVTYEDLPRFVTVIDLEAGFAQLGKYAALFQIDDQYLLIGQEGGSASLPIQQPGTPLRWPSELEQLVLSGGLLSVGELRPWNGTIGMELAADGWLAFVGFGMSSAGASTSLIGLYPVVKQEGYELVGEIERANLVSLGACYEVAPNLYVLGSLGSLYVAGIYEGSSRLRIDDELLPAPFAGRTITLSFGLGLRIHWAMLSLQVLLTL